VGVVLQNGDPAEVSLYSHRQRGFDALRDKGFSRGAPSATLTAPSGEARSPMRWFRSHKLEVAALALFALACQFVLSFGHVHLDRTAGFSSGRAIAAAVGSAIAAPAGKVTLADLPTSPREKNPDSLGDDFCAICANISLAAAIVLPIVLLFLLGTAHSESLIWFFAATRAASTNYVHFDARGPPAA
jgi:hypothetical protein